MSKRKTMIKNVWRVRVEDAQYTSQVDHFLLLCATASMAELIALRSSKKRNKLAKGDPPSLPFIRSIELIGDLDN